MVLFQLYSRMWAFILPDHGGIILLAQLGGQADRTLSAAASVHVHLDYQSPTEDQRSDFEDQCLIFDLYLSDALIYAVMSIV